MGRPGKKIPPDVTLSLDFGGSGLKGVYRKYGGKDAALYMEPEVIEVEKESLVAKTQPNLSRSAPENLAWVGIGTEYKAVGYLAATQYRANLGLSQKKYQLALSRALAAVWVVKEKLKLPKTFRLAMATLLPPGEYSDTPVFFSALKEGLKEFDTPTGKMGVSLVDFCCHPEGTGVYFGYVSNQLEEVKLHTIATIMVGYRNASVFLSRRGILENGKTTSLGMVYLVDLVGQKTSALRTDVLLKALGSVEREPEMKHFLSLTEKNKSPEARKNDAEKIVEAVSASRKEYVTALTSWLNEVVPSSVEKLIVCGGTIDCLNLRAAIDRAFPGVPIEWHGKFEMPELGEKWLGNRLADAYELSRYFNQYLNSKYAILSHA